MWSTFYYNKKHYGILSAYKITIFKFLLVDNEIFYSTLEFIEVNKILPIGIILSTLSSVYLFLREFEIKKFIIW